MELKELIAQYREEKRTGLQIIRVDTPKDWEIGPGVLKELLATPRVLYWNFRRKNHHGPLEPLLDWLSLEYRMLPEQAKQSLWNQVEFYPFHRNLIQNLLERKASGRLDDIFRTREELEFEQGILWTSLWALIATLMGSLNPRGPLDLVFLENIDQAGPGSLAFLTHGLVNTSQELPLILGVLGSGGGLLQGLKEEKRQKFFQVLESQDRIRHRAIATPENLSPLSSKKVSRSTSELTAELENMSALLLLERPRLDKPPGGSARDRADFHLALSRVLLQCEELTDALVHCRSFLNQGTKSRSSRIWMGHFLLSMAHMRKQDLTLASKHLGRSKHFQPTTVSLQEKLALDTAHILVNEKNWEEPSNQQSFFDLMDQVAQYPHEPFTWLLRVMLSYYRALRRKIGLEKAISAALQNLQAIQKQKNLFQEARLMHMLGFLFQDQNPEQALKYFEHGIELRIQLGSTDGLIKTYNGVGYYCFSLGQHGKSLAYFQKALELLEKTGDFVEICLTLFNVGLTYFLGGQYSRSFGIFQNILEVMDALGIESLPWHSREKLYFLTGCSAYYLKLFTLSLDYWEKSSNSKVPYESQPAYFLLKSQIQRLGGDTATPLELLDLALERSRELYQGIFAAHIILEKIVWAKESGDHHRGQEWIKAAEQSIPNTNASDQRRLFDHIKKGGSFHDYPQEGRGQDRIRSIAANVVNLAKRESANIALFRRLGEISFIKNFQDSVHRDRSESSNFRTTKILILREFPLSEFDLIHQDEDELEIFIAHPAKKKNRIFPRWSDFWGNHSRLVPKLWSTEKEIHLAYPFRGDKIDGIFAYIRADKGGSGLENSEMEIIKMALSHLEMTLILSRAQEELRRRVTTDALTGATSRQEFLRVGSRECKRSHRYHQSENPRPVSLMYMDLDHFKSVNDTLGHAMGDELLKAFTKVIQSNIRDLDVLGRLGGDEFALILPETDIKGAQVVAQRILDKWSQAAALKKANRDLIAQGISKQCSSSIGLAQLSGDTKQDFGELIEKADGALYKAKKGGKGRFALAD